MQEYKPATNCPEFHEQLPFLMDAGKTVEDEPHLRSCENCRLLVRDLRYIAEQAKLLLPMHDPSPRVWNNIQETLQKEGLSTEGRLPGPRPIVNLPLRSSWKLIGTAAVIAGVIAIAIGQFQTLPANPAATAPASASKAVNAPGGLEDWDAEDAQLLAQVEGHSPAMRAVYADGLRRVNAYIADAKSMLEQDPDDAREYLREAYAQKAMLYHMATARSFK
jgi:hypothetical protein